MNTRKNKNIILFFILSIILLTTSCGEIEKAFEETFKNEGVHKSEIDVYFEIRGELLDEISSRELDYVLDVVQNSRDYGKYLDDENLSKLLIEAKEEVRKNSLLSQKDTLREAQE